MLSKTIKYCTSALLLGLLMLTSCSQESGTVDEYANWHSRNDKAFSDTLAYAHDRIALGDSTWKVFCDWSLAGQIQYGNTVLTHTGVDSIIVHVVQKGTGSGCPFLTDSVRVHYAAYLINGHCFDCSWTGDELDPSTAVPAGFNVKEVIDGFATALMKMHIGDRWTIYIPYHLGYGSSSNGTSGTTSYIPAYSMLKFDVTLHSYYRNSINSETEENENDN
ncbi:MAG: FKBP-type peptidyl-prolyl cis-trans isomerase [Prevotella sp.]|jgi:FKBP-type peptidyl-prolyl cis-trans isomerase FklB|nr:FKBP-type peptidyl-prolyl cis-trans isomerase [Prevotella sp.]MCH4250987.1 FKBP-type peptidyl-prolyl cis-trans isomerase [Prevotella sp.]MCI1473374.1 FKBP-type peptidyl-prolyl cis-trans isomerase [Prevotella sp.]MCI1518178.1 FKBP-type peptidyl-prolyl cis-trans isomerase [Prevotella sp.]MCI1548905.1 FKBP-type peptidyl-prolyl cis-trans isomerase [Prevotella sp.]